MRFFLYFTILFAFTVSLQAQNIDDYGQTKLNSDLRELLTRNESIEDFKKKRRITEIDELYWTNAKVAQNISQEPSTTNSCFQDFRIQVSKMPYHLVHLGSKLADCVQLAMTRPVEGSLFLFKLIKNLFPIFIFSLLTLFLLHLALWRPAIQQDLTNRFQVRSLSSFLTLIFACLFLTAVFHIWLQTCLLLVGLTVLYSRKKKQNLWLMGFLAFFISFTSFFGHLEYRLEQASLQEALAKGRNSVAYSLDRLSSLQPWEKSLWSHLNQDRIQEKKWLDATPSSYEKDVLQVNFLFSPASPEKTLRSYQQLNASYPNDPVILFNLWQLLTQTQDLISADEYRAKMNPDLFNQLLLMKEASGEELLYPSPKSYFIKAFYKALQDFADFFAGSSGSQLGFLFSFFIPWLVLLVFYFLRNKSSGLCSSTYLPTSSSSETFSQLAATATQRSEAVEPNLRQRYTRAQRRKDLRASKLFKAFSFFVMRADQVIEGKKAFSLILTFLTYSILWLSFSLSFRSHVSSFFGFPFDLQIRSLGFSFSIFLIGIFLVWLIRYLGKRRMIL